jgi:hypothetical protein
MHCTSVSGIKRELMNANVLILSDRETLGTYLLRRPDGDFGL